jgi:hypothetical protein
LFAELLGLALLFSLALLGCEMFRRAELLLLLLLGGGLGLRLRLRSEAVKGQDGS